MKTTLKADLRRLSGLAFHRGEWGRELMRRIHRLRREAKDHPDLPLLEAIHSWLLKPLTLWPIHLEDLGRDAATRIEAGQRLDPQIQLLLSFLNGPPREAAQAVVSQHEHAVQSGDYASLIHAQHKFDHAEERLAHDPEFQADWQRVKSAFNVTQFRDRKGIIRRRMVPERNYRTDWRLKWGSQAARFAAVFDVFCWRWHLYGMERDKPLLMKLTVNLTPYGTMIIIPAYWSLDPKRDLKWRAIAALHKARGVPRQGPKLGQNQIALIEDAGRVRELWTKATAAGLRGKQRTRTVMEQMHWHPDTDESKLRRLLRRVPQTKAPKIS